MSAEELPHPMTPVPAPGQADPVAGPRQLTPVSITRDGSRLVLVDADGNEFTVAVDPSLRTALPATPAAAGPSRRSEKTSMSTSPSLRPRDIQARIRAGESPESVADAAGTTVERIMPFAAPVLAEREHIAERALKASVRRRAGDPASGAAARTLGSAVTAQLSTIDASEEAVEWDSWRRTDGRWSLVALYTTSARSGTAELTFDLPGNFVSLDNDDARWLVGDLVEPEAAPVLDDLAQARVRRLAPPPVAAPAPAPVSEGSVPEAAAEVTVDVTPDERAEEPTEAPAARQSADQQLPLDEPLEAFLDGPSEAPLEKPSSATAEEQPVAEEETAPKQQPARRTPSKKRGRASVPSWDEIMFGGGGGS